MRKLVKYQFSLALRVTKAASRIKNDCKSFIAISATVSVRTIKTPKRLKFIAQSLSLNAQNSLKVKLKAQNTKVFQTLDKIFVVLIDTPSQFIQGCSSWGLFYSLKTQIHN